MNAIEIRGLRKVYGDVEAVAGLDRGPVRLTTSLLRRRLEGGKKKATPGKGQCVWNALTRYIILE